MYDDEPETPQPKYDMGNFAKELMFTADILGWVFQKMWRATHPINWDEIVIPEPTREEKIVAHLEAILRELGYEKRKEPRHTA